MRRFACFLGDSGVQPGNLVAISLPQNVAISVAFACLQVGAKFVFSSAKLPNRLSEGVDFHIALNGDQGSKVLRIDNQVMAYVRTLNPLEHVHNFHSKDEIVALFGTSGTSGERKFAEYPLATFSLRSQRSLWGQEDFSGPVMRLQGIDAAAGFFSVTQDIFKGRPMIFETGKVSLESRLATIELLRPTTLRCAPSQLLQLLTSPISRNSSFQSIRAVSLIGASVDKALMERVFQAMPGVKLNVSYGSSEAGITHGKTLVESDIRIPEQAGKLLAGEIQIWKEDGIEVSIGEIGLIAIKDDHMVTSYFRDPQATSIHFRNDFFVSGDRGWLDSDGTLYVVGRESELINLGGVKIDPTKIDLAAKSLPGVRDAGSFEIYSEVGIPEIAIAIVPENESFSREEFLVELSKSLEKRYVPKNVHLVSALPLNENGKLLRRSLSAMFDRKSN